MLGEFQPGSDTYYLLGLDVIGQQQGTDWSYFGYDGLGSVRQLTNPSGAVSYSANYDPYGLPLEQFGTGTTNLGFTGEYTDPSGLLYLRARYANLSIGSFLTRDPVGGVMGMSASYNGYGYVQGNPVNLTDPSGKFPFLAVIAGGLIGGGIDLAMQLLVEGKDLQCVDWGSVAFSALTGAVGGGIGSLTNKMGLIARLTIDILSDTAVSTAIDVAFRGAEFGDSFRRNLMAGAFGTALGEAGGKLIGAGLKRAKSLGRWLRGAGDAAGESVERNTRSTLNNLTEQMRGNSRAGHGVAEEVIPGGTGQAFAGHGIIPPMVGSTVVPEGTSVRFWIGEGDKMPNGMGLLIEKGEYDALRNHVDYGRRVSEMTYDAGDTVPDYLLRPPDELTIMSNSITVGEETALSDLLQPNMGCMDWAACLEYPLRKY